MDPQPIELRIPALTLGLTLNGFRGNTDMGGRYDIDATLGIGSPIDLNVDAGQGQMAVLVFVPSLALLD